MVEQNVRTEVWIDDVINFKEMRMKNKKPH